MTAVALPHAHWHAATAITPGPAVIFDLDGVLADAMHRQHFLHRETPDWTSFYRDVHRDAVIEAGRALLSCMRDDVTIIILTARVDEVAVVTREWLAAQGLRFDLLVCRPPREDDDAAVAVDYKRVEIRRMLDWGIEPLLGIDDNRRIVDMYDEFGIPSLYFPSGYYDSSARYDGGV
jgi:hypothetical protein